MSSQIVSVTPKIIIGHGLQQDLQSTIDEFDASQILVLVDENTHKHCLPLYSSCLVAKIVIIPSGEINKSFVQSQHIWDELLALGGGRSSVVIAIGGGLLCDLAAFAASTFMRGIRFILMPSTLLAIVDASVGGKTGFNYNGYKNIIGSFREADVVLADLDFMQTLPRREFVSGYAEVVKHSLLQGDLSWQNLLANSPYQLSATDLAGSIRYKRSITMADFDEKGKREILNLGHTTAHALESIFLKNEAHLLHGEAVAAGLWIESYLSEHYFKQENKNWFEELRSLIKTVFPKVEYPIDSINDIINTMYSDKKNKTSKIYFSLLKTPGHADIGCIAEEQQIRNALLYYLKDA